MMKIAISCDHAGYDLKEALKKRLTEKGYDVKDYGSHSAKSVDYSDYGHLLADAVEQGTVVMGISICGSGNGINMTANKHQGIRSALCWTDEIARLARQHNDANICALPARFINIEQAQTIVDTFLETGFDGGRHQQRIDKIPIK